MKICSSLGKHCSFHEQVLYHSRQLASFYQDSQLCTPLTKHLIHAYAPCCTVSACSSCAPYTSYTSLCATSVGLHACNIDTDSSETGNTMGSQSYCDTGYLHLVCVPCSIQCCPAWPGWLASAQLLPARGRAHWFSHGSSQMP